MAFRLVCGLWVTPDFSEVAAGRATPPRVNHSKVDYVALATFIKELFPYGPPVSIQVPNDTIDQVTLHQREGRPSMRCEDFGKALLAEAKKQKTVVVNVRPAWEKLHILADRDFAPPPCIIPFVATATDFEDAMLWHASTRPSLGLPMFDVLAAMNQAPMEQNGALDESALKKLGAIFGAPFEKFAVLDQMASDPKPAYART